MRAVVMEIIDGNHLIVLSRTGEFKKVKRSTYNIELGMEIKITNFNYDQTRRIAAIILLFIFMGSFGLSTYAYYTPYGYVNMEMNPSVEVVYNRFKRVLDIQGVNEDGEEIVLLLDNYKYQSIEEVLGKVLNIELQYKNQGVVDILITTNKKIDTSISNLMEKLEDVADRLDIQVYTNYAKKSEYEAAKEESLSPGKSILVDRIIQESTTLEEENLDEKTINELVKMTKKEKNPSMEKDDNKKEDKKQNKIKSNKSNNDKDENGWDKKNQRDDKGKENNDRKNEDRENDTSKNDDNSKDNDKKQKVNEEKKDNKKINNSDSEEDSDSEDESYNEMNEDDEKGRNGDRENKGHKGEKNIKGNNEEQGQEKVIKSNSIENKKIIKKNKKYFKLPQKVEDFLRII